MADRIQWDRRELDELLVGPDGAVAKALTKAAIQVQRRSRQIAPVDTGRLRSSISYAVERDAGGLVAKVGTNVEYARHLEYGTVKMRPRPFLRPALSSLKGARLA
jgi:HK97 gp10 family phage protein